MALKMPPMALVPVVRTKRVGNIVALRPRMTPQIRRRPLSLVAIKTKNLSRNRYVLKNKISSTLLIKIMITILLRILLGVITRESLTIRKSQLLTKLITRRRSSSSRLKVQNLSKAKKDLRS